MKKLLSLTRHIILSGRINHQRRAMSYIINDNDEKYAFLRRLGLQEVNLGSFDGNKWIGQGEKVTSISPVNNRPIADVVLGTVEDYEQCVGASIDAWQVWAGNYHGKRYRINIE